ncbi:hypothetical protein GCM10020358_32910 [Amorphoplanes nipponensis]|uniref:SCP domain-containing protein n=1 Tax=Actinoplanes nipponensis TaxID=135950 RepID=A0A919MVN0_9ACTN|nr:CAP domain-containing protein [Actinoplanes nipponensis]GIE51335.1 hypothetical protein Ani05nite_48690 [Actinoplanes nipponensis]
MRKPAVVVAAAVSAVLAGGVMVATTAGAQETPVTPAAPAMALPELPAVPQAPGDAGGPVNPALPAVPGAADGAAPARPGAPTGSAKPAADRPGATTAAARPPAHPANRPAPASPAKADDRADEQPTVDKPARTTKASNVSAAQRDVTTSQALSTDPGGSVQQQALALVNENRRRGGCDDVTVDRRLIVAANGHADEMARRGYFAHEDSRGGRAGDRVTDAGYQWSRYGENIARGQDSVAEVVDGWMRSPEHRENIMDCGLREVGVGLAFSADRTPYWVQDFATPQ